MTRSLTAAAVKRLRFHLTVKSGNKKTGRMPVSTSSRDTCSADCPLRGHGCYAEYGPLALHWAAVTSGTRGMPWPLFLAAIQRLPLGQLWRHCQAGDLVDPNTAVGRAMLAELTAASRGRRGYTYTHHRRGRAMIAACRAATADGFTVNASCSGEADADAAIASGLRAVFIVPAAESRTSWATAGGNRAVLCPAQRLEGKVDCATCQLCHSRPQEIAVAFRAHGTARRRVEAVISAAP